MNNLLSLCDLSEESRQLLRAHVMTSDEKNRLCKSIADDLTYEKIHELMLAIFETEPFDVETNMDRFLWLTRAAYLYGFKKALDAYSGAFEISLRERKNHHE